MKELYTKVSCTEDDDAMGVLRLIKAGADLEWQNPDDEMKCVIHTAVVYDRSVYLEILCQNGASVFSIDTRQWTPMVCILFYC